MPTYTKPISNTIDKPPALGKPYDMTKLNSAAQTQAALTKGGAPGVSLPGQSEQTANVTAMLLGQSKANAEFDNKTKVGGKRRTKKVKKSSRNRKSKKYLKKSRR